MIINSSLFNEAKGSLGNMIVYTVKGQVRVRAKSMSHKDKKSIRQLEQRQRIKGITRLYQLLDFAFLYSWKERTRQMTMNGCNLFIKENIGNITPEGQVDDPALLRISTGPLPLPREFRLSRDENEDFILTWDTDKQELETIRYDDLLQIGVYGYSLEVKETAVLHLRHVKPSRRDCQCRFGLPPGTGVRHLYASFKCLYTNEYSESVYIGSYT